MSNGTVQCKCGEIMGEACGWSGPREQTVRIEWMPEHLRASHDAAGDAGVYPTNGAVRLRVERSCAERILADDGEWAERILADDGEWALS